MRIQKHRNQHDHIAQKHGEDRLLPIHSTRDHSASQHIRRNIHAHRHPKRGVVVGSPGPLIERNRREVFVPKPAVLLRLSDLRAQIFFARVSAHERQTLSRPPMKWHDRRGGYYRPGLDFGLRFRLADLLSRPFVRPAKLAPNFRHRNPSNYLHTRTYDAPIHSKAPPRPRTSNQHSRLRADNRSALSTNFSSEVHHNLSEARFSESHKFTRRQPAKLHRRAPRLRHCANHNLATRRLLENFPTKIQHRITQRARRLHVANCTLAHANMRRQFPDRDEQTHPQRAMQINRAQRSVSSRGCRYHASLMPDALVVFG